MATVASAAEWRDVKIKAFDNVKHRTYVDLKGEVTDKDMVERKIREYQIDVVISAIGGHALTEQLSLVEAIKAAGNVKRFLPSEFGHDIGKANPVEPAQVCTTLRGRFGVQLRMQGFHTRIFAVILLLDGFTLITFTLTMFARHLTSSKFMEMAINKAAYSSHRSLNTLVHYVKKFVYSYYDGNIGT